MRMPLVVGLILLAIPAFAQNAVQIRAGEHSDYSRLVIPVPSDSQWELISSGRKAILLLPELDRSFNTERIFDRIPKTRVLSVSSETSSGNTRIEISMACACDIVAKIEAATLILDVYDEKSEKTEIAAETEASDTPNEPSEEEDNVTDGVSKPTPRPTISNNAEEPSNPDAPKTPEDLADRLITQLTKAAEQGLVDLADPPSEEKKQPNTSPVEEPAETNQNAQNNNGLLEPDEQSLDGLGAVGSRMEQALKDASNDLGGSVRITVPEGSIAEPDKRTKPKKKSDPKPTETAKNNCPDDEQLDVQFWADERPFSEQLSTLQSRIFGEFDEPDPETVLELVRLYIFYGLGTEATSLLKDVGFTDPQSELLREIANTAEGKPFIPNGILDKAVDCPGAVSMWRAAALDTVETQPITDTSAILKSFAELPIEARRLIGPRLVTSFLNRGQREVANQVFDIVDRAAGDHGQMHEFQRAKLTLLEGQAEEAEGMFWELVYNNTDQSDSALIALVDSRLARGEAIPENVMTVLEAQSFQARGSDIGHQLRLTEVRAKAGSGGVREALKIATSEIEASPDLAGEYFATANLILEQTSASETGEVEYATTIFENLDMITSDAISEPVTKKIASQMLTLGLPEVAQNMLDSLEPAQDLKTAEIYASAQLLRDDPNAALETLNSNPMTPQTASLKAKALSKLLEHDAALEVIADQTEDLKVNYAWRAGDWNTAAKSRDPDVSDLAKFMRDRQEPSQALEQEEISLRLVKALQGETQEIRATLTKALKRM